MKKFTLNFEHRLSIRIWLTNPIRLIVPLGSIKTTPLKRTTSKVTLLETKIRKKNVVNAVSVGIWHFEPVHLLVRKGLNCHQQILATSHPSRVHAFFTREENPEPPMIMLTPMRAY